MLGLAPVNCTTWTSRLEIETLYLIATPFILLGILVAMKAGCNEVIKGLDAIHQAIESETE